MYSNEIESVIAEYFKNPIAEYAVMIDGDWGSGKTYFLTHSLMRIMETIDLGKDKRRKYAYVSLYGAKSIDEISKEIVFQCLGRKNKKKVETVDTVLETASNILTASLGAVNIDLSKIKDTLAKIDINNWIICFDDLERCCLPINEILGYFNRLVEHNKCKIIVLANEKEIGKINLNQKLEDKYQVVLSGKKLLLDKTKKSNKDDTLDIKKLQDETKELFNEDILYKLIREKVIGLTIRYEPQMDVAYDSLVLNYSRNERFHGYLIERKSDILKHFYEEDCYNLRTLISVLESIAKIYEEMLNNNYNTVKYFDKIMKEFIKYIVEFTIFYKNGGKASDLKLTSEIGYVSLGQNIFSHTRGFKFLERYCTTLSFSKQEFSRAVSILRQEYEEEEQRILKDKIGLAKAYGDLSNWWELEDNEVNKLIQQLIDEVKNDKYPFNSYQGIISQLIVLEKYGFDIGSMDSLIVAMNHNIEQAEENVNIERFSYAFKDNEDLQKKYDSYVDQLKLTVSNKEHIIKSNQMTQYLTSDKWSEQLFNYCEEHYNEFLSRYGFIDLLDTDLLLNKMSDASTKEIYKVKDIFKTVYRVSNINDFFSGDIDKIMQFTGKVKQINFTGINKPMAKKALEDYLDDIIKRLKKSHSL